MPSRREQVARSVADRLAAAGALPLVVVGFDGFVDTILDAVDFRRDMSPDGYERIRTMEQLAQRIGAAAGKSMNLEIVQREERWGGNGPLLAGVLGRLGVPVTYIGAVGREDDYRVLHPAYEGFAFHCHQVMPIASPGKTQALEFDNGKVMLNEPNSVQDVTWERVVDEVGGEHELVKLLEPAALLGLVNWSLMGGVDEIFAGLIEHVLPQIAASGEAPQVFVDLTDPAKRRDDDLLHILGLLRRMNAIAPVTLGMNLAEADRISSVSGGPVFSGHDEFEQAAAALRERLDLACVVVHRRQGAAAACEKAGASETASFDAPFVTKPRISTGAGDHFNGGFALGSLLGMPLAESLALGCATAGFYVRQTVAPDRNQLIEFLRQLPQPEREGE